MTKELENKIDETLKNDSKQEASQKNNHFNNSKKYKKNKFKKPVNKEKELQKEIDRLNDLVTNQNIEIAKLKLEMQQQISDFQSKAQGFAKKAQEELAKHKESNNTKLNEEISQLKKYGNQKFFEEFIIVYNNLHLAINAGTKQDNVAVQNYVRGFEMLFNQMTNLLSEFGLEQITPQLKDLYNPELHQVFEIISSDEIKDSILEVKSIGYKLHDRVLKPALVNISSGQNEK